MLVIKIELWPGGRVTQAREIARVFIGNDSMLSDVSDYTVRAEEVGNPELGIAPRADKFRIKGHNRNQSVFALLAKVFSRYSEPQKTKT